MNGAWRVDEEARGPLSQVYDGDRFVGEFVLLADARAAVAALNAQSEAEPVAEPVAWTLMSRALVTFSKKAALIWSSGGHKVTPLFAAPPLPVDALAVVKRLRDETWRSQTASTDYAIQLDGMSKMEAADEIIRELEGGR